MPSRTHQALGLGWSTWIDLLGDNKGPVILTSSKNGTPHAYLETHADAERVFGVKKGAPIDNQPNSDVTRSFVTDFAPEVLERIKVESAQFYADKFEEADKADEDEADAEATTRRTTADAPARSKKTSRKTGS